MGSDSGSWLYRLPRPRHVECDEATWNLLKEKKKGLPAYHKSSGKGFLLVVDKKRPKGVAT